MPEELIKVSPSQVNTFRTCERKWGHEKIGGHVEPEKQGTALGTYVHGILEAYAEHGTAPDTEETWQFEPGAKTFYPGVIALNMITRVMPPPGVAVTEGEFEFQPGPNDPIVRGFVDLGYEGSEHSFPELDAIDGPVLVVVDHKTSSNPKKWGKTEESLPKDPQAIMYAMAALHEWRQSNTGPPPLVLCAWNYGATSGKPSGGKIVFALFTPKEVFAAFKALLPTIRKIARLRKERPDPNTLKFNAGACSMYGGCPHRDRCNLTNEQKLESLMSNSLLDDLLDEEQSTAPPETELPPPVEGDQVNPPEATSGGGLLDDLLGDDEPSGNHIGTNEDAARQAALNKEADPVKPKPIAKTKGKPNAKPVEVNVSAEIDYEKLADRVVSRFMVKMAQAILAATDDGYGGHE